jgi:hypothetical protein
MPLSFIARLFNLMKKLLILTPISDIQLILNVLFKFHDIESTRIYNNLSNK